MELYFLKYHVNDNHSFLFNNIDEFNTFLTANTFDTQTFQNEYISEDTSEINYQIKAEKPLDAPQEIGYIIAVNGEITLNFIVNSWRRLSNGVIKFFVTSDIFRNDLNGLKYLRANKSPNGNIDQTNGYVNNLDKTQIVPFDLGDDVAVEKETYPLTTTDGKNWVIVICAETVFGNYTVVATDYANDIGTMTAIARVMTMGTTITRDDDETKTSNFKAVSCYIIPKTIIRSGYNNSTAFTINTEKAVKVYSINAYFKKTEVILPYMQPLKKYDFGTIGTRIKINKQFDAPLYILTAFNSSDISIGILYNNIYLDVTSEFELPIVTDEFAQYATLNKKSLITKGITSAASIGVGIVSKNPIAVVGGVLQAGSTVAEMFDKSEQPFDITANAQGAANITFNNGFSFRTYTGRSYAEAARVAKTFGYKYQDISASLNTLLFDGRRIGKIFIRYKFLENSEKFRPATFAKLLNGVFV